MLMWFMYIYAFSLEGQYEQYCKSYMDHRQSGRGRQYLPSEGRGNDLLSPIYRGQVISTFSFPPAQQNLHEILTGTEFTSNVTSLIVTEACEVSRCQAARGKVARLLLNK